MKKTSFIKLYIIGFIILSLIMNSDQGGKTAKMMFDRCYDQKQLFASLALIEIEDRYIINIIGTNKYIIYNKSGELLQLIGIKAIKKDSFTDQIVGKSWQEIYEKYGEPHMDTGSGFFIPAYILEDGRIARLWGDESNGVEEVCIDNIITILKNK